MRDIALYRDKPRDNAIQRDNNALQAEANNNNIIEGNDNDDNNNDNKNNIICNIYMLQCCSADGGYAAMM